MGEFVSIIIGIIAISRGLIPAFIAKKKHRSFGLFYIFGLFSFVSATVVVLCLSDKFADKKTSLGGIKATFVITATIILTKVLMDVLETIELTPNTMALLEGYAANLSESGTIIFFLIFILAIVFVAFIFSVLLMFLLHHPLSYLADKLDKLLRID